MAEVNRLESCIENGVSEWLNLNCFDYDLTHMNNLIRRLCAVLDMHDTTQQLRHQIEGEMDLWRTEKTMAATLTDYNGLRDDLVDRIKSLRDMLFGGGFRHAS